MKKKIVILGVILCVCLITGSIAGDNSGFFQQRQPPMGGPMSGQQNGQMTQGQPPMGGPKMSDQQPGQQNGQMMQGQPPLKLASVEAEDDDAVYLLADADSDAVVLKEITDGAVVEIMEKNGDYVKVRINGTVGYVLSSELSELQPGDGSMPPMPNNGQQPPAKPGDGQEPPAKPEDGQEPPAKPEDGQQPPAKPEDGQVPPAKPEDGQQPPAKPGDGQEPPAMSGSNNQQPPAKPAGNSTENDSLEPGIQNFFKALLRYLNGETANS